MVRGFVSSNGGPMTPIAGLDGVRAAADRPDATLWVDVEQPTLEQLNELGGILGLVQEALEDSLEGSQRPRVDEYENHLFIVLYGAVGPEDLNEFHPRKLTILFSSRFMVTIHAEPLRTINTQLKRFERRQEVAVKQGLDYLLYSIVDSMVDNYGLVVETYAEQLDALEERSLHAEGDPAVLSELVDVRRELLHVRRMIASMRELVSPIAAGEMDYVSEDLEPRFSHVRDHLTTTLELVDSHREILHAIRENYNLWLANRMNEVMKVLTIFASFFLPLSLIAGIYGMNTPLWPDPSSPRTFWEIIVLMSLTAGAMLVYFWRKKWF